MRRNLLSHKFFYVAILILLGSTIFSPSIQADQTKMVEIILDASGSMNGRLADGQLKIVAAKEAVTKIAEKLPDDLTLAFRAYGHQSPREKKDCLDTQLLVGFAALKDIRTDIIEKTNALKAQGYTPITYVLGKAALDFPDDKEMEKIIILVSDGKETCEGDPCVTAKNMKDKDVQLAVHTIGFGVDEATREQLDCISRVTGGTYFDANSMEELISVLTAAVETVTLETIEEEGVGWLEVDGADLRGHEVTNAETGEGAGFISSVSSIVELPAGIYNVTIGGSIWKSVEVVNGETTSLRPGWLEVNHASFRGHSILEAETREEHGQVSSLAHSIALMPGEYDVTFGEITWAVKVEAGKTMVLNAGIVGVDGASYRGHDIRTKNGKYVGYVSNTAASFTLPPGEYTIQIGDKTVAFSLEEGQELTIENK